MPYRFQWTSCFSTFLPGLVLLMLTAASGQAQDHRREVTEAMHRAVIFFREHASAGGGYVYRISADLRLREGEEQVGQTTAWIEPPATPAVGMAYLNAWKKTGDPLLKEATLDTAEALLRGQLKSGGWDNLIEFAPDDRLRYAYRIDGGHTGKLRNTTTFDDNKSQSCLRFLMSLDQALEFKDQRIHEACLYALEAFLNAQYPNGAWPQRYAEFPKAEEYPVIKASIPEVWPRTYPARNYACDYTLNDNTISDIITTMLDASDIYHDERCLTAAKKGGDFFLLAQLPEPQPGWAQQYDKEMHPVWARKFEPPAITGGESQGVLRTLILLYRRTADRKYLQPIPRALEYYNSLVLPSGGLARFYQLGTDKPLYFTKDYQLVYTADDLPTHYGFITGNNLKQIAADYDKWSKTSSDKLWVPDINKPTRISESLTSRALEIARKLDDRGAWLDAGKMTNYQDDSVQQVIDTRTFIKNLNALADYLSATPR